MKVKLFYVMHTDNLEGEKHDYLMSKYIEYEEITKYLDDMAINSDGEQSYTPLFLVNESLEIIRRFDK